MTDKETKTVAPFSMKFVLEKTTQNMLGSIEFSTNRTIFRVLDFVDDPQKLKEVQDTLEVLASMHKMVKEFQDNNKSLFEEV